MQLQLFSGFSKDRKLQIDVAWYKIKNGELVSIFRLKDLEDMSG